MASSQLHEGLKIYNNHLCDSLALMRKDRTFSDLIFVCQGGKDNSFFKHINAHQAIFSTVSQFFRELFQTTRQKQPYEKVMISITSVDHVMLEKIIDCIYGDIIYVNEHEMHQFADLCKLLNITITLNEIISGNSYTVNVCDYNLASSIGRKDTFEKLSNPTILENHSQNDEETSTYCDLADTSKEEPPDFMLEGINYSATTDQLFCCSRHCNIRNNVPVIEPERNRSKHNLSILQNAEIPDLYRKNNYGKSYLRADLVDVQKIEVKNESYVEHYEPLPDNYHHNVNSPEISIMTDFTSPLMAVPHGPINTSIIDSETQTIIDLEMEEYGKIETDYLFIKEFNNDTATNGNTDYKPEVFANKRVHLQEDSYVAVEGIAKRTRSSLHSRTKKS